MSVRDCAFCGGTFEASKAYKCCSAVCTELLKKANYAKAVLLREYLALIGPEGQAAKAAFNRRHCEHQKRYYAKNRDRLKEAEREGRLMDARLRAANEAWELEQTAKREQP